jgi:alpha-amylase/alpha-mannosidase (GH57 family)
VSFIIWTPNKRNNQAKKFYKEVQRNLRQRQQELHSHNWRSKFYEKHRKWILGHLDEVFTPRSIKRYRDQLYQSYQEVLNLRPEHQYQVSVEAESQVDLVVPEIMEEEQQDEDIIKLINVRSNGGRTAGRRYHQADQCEK